jgi:hypothetical protein
MPFFPDARPDNAQCANLQTNLPLRMEIGSMVDHAGWPRSIAAQMGRHIGPSESSPFRALKSDETIRVLQVLDRLSRAAEGAGYGGG